MASENSVELPADEICEREAIHLAQFWHRGKHEDFTWTLGRPIQAKLPHFRVRRIAPPSLGDPWVYATIGVWEATPTDPIELFLLAPDENPLHVELLAMAAHFHADPKYRLQIGSVIDIGRPWIEGSRCEQLLVSLPYPYGPDLERCTIGELIIRYLWLVPITPAEAGLARRDGADALERIFEANDVDLLAPNRPSLV
jgi:hypothetical protein